MLFVWHDEPLRKSKKRQRSIITFSKLVDFCLLLWNSFRRLTPNDFHCRRHFKIWIRSSDSVFDEKCSINLLKTVNIFGQTTQRNGKNSWRNINNIKFRFVSSERFSRTIFWELNCFIRFCAERRNRLDRIDARWSGRKTRKRRKRKLWKVDSSLERTLQRIVGSRIVATNEKQWTHGHNTRLDKSVKK